MISIIILYSCVHTNIYKNTHYDFRFTIKPQIRHLIRLIY